MRPTCRSLRRRFLRLGPVRLMLSSFLLGVGVLLATALLREHWRTSTLVPIEFSCDERAPIQYAEILRPGETTPIASTYIPSREALNVPEGSYHLRISRAGRLSRTYRFSVNPNIYPEIEIPKLGGELWETDLGGKDPSAYSPRFEFVQCKRGRDVVAIECGSSKLLRLDGRSGAILWRQSVPEWKEASPEPKDTEEPDLVPPSTIVDRRDPNWEPIVAGDLDGDGDADTIWVDWSGLKAFALSSANGRILWDTSKLHSEYQSRPLPESVYVSLRSKFLLLPDSDGDGIRDLAIAFDYTDSIAAPGLLPCGVEVVSGKTGKRMWKFLPDVPPMSDDPPIYIQMARRNGREVLALTVQDRIEWLSTKDGTTAFPSTSLGAPAYAKPIIEDPDGDNNADVVAFTTPASQNFRLSAIATANGEIAWSYPLGEDTKNDEDVLPRLMDVDHDRIPEILIPPASSRGRPEVIVLDGRNGQVRWKQSVAFSEEARGYGYQSEVVMALNFDINADGFNDIIRAAWCSPLIGPEGLYLELEGISGIDGRTLWLNRSPSESYTTGLTIRTWGTGSDGKPLIVVSPRAHFAAAKAGTTTLFTSTTGLIDSTVRRMNVVATNDLDGDGFEELIGLGGRILTPLRPEVPVLWRHQQRLRVGDEDRNRDGFKDLLSQNSDWFHTGFSPPVINSPEITEIGPSTNDEQTIEPLMRSPFGPEQAGTATGGSPLGQGDPPRPAELIWKSMNGRRSLLFSGEGIVSDPTTKRPVWKSVGPISDPSKAGILVPNAEWKAPILLEHNDEGTVARPMVLVDEDPELEASWDRSGPAPMGRDPRAAFALPWWIHPLILEATWEILLGAVMMTFAVFALPCLIFIATQKRTRSGIMRLMSLIAAVAVGIWGYGLREYLQYITIEVLQLSVFGRFLPEDWIQRLSNDHPTAWMISIGLPVVGLIGLLGCPLLRKQYRRFWTVVGVIVGLSAIIGPTWLAFDPLPPGGWRAWDCWWILPAGVAYAVGLAAIPVWIVASAVRALRRVGAARRNV